MNFNPHCRSCRRLTSYLQRIKKQHPDYHCAPVAAFGDPSARLLIVGLAPGLHGANRTGRPFTGDSSGELLFQTLHRRGLASAGESLSCQDGLELVGCRITNAVRCLPPQNKPTTDELKRCSRYLETDIAGLTKPAIVLALGKQAHESVLRVLGEKLAKYPFSHAAEHRINEDLMLLDSYHCSRYNTQTKRLTPQMFDAVFVRARQWLEQSL